MLSKFRAKAPEPSLIQQAEDSREHAENLLEMAVEALEAAEILALDDVEEAEASIRALTSAIASLNNRSQFAMSVADDAKSRREAL